MKVGVEMVVQLMEKRVMTEPTVTQMMAVMTLVKLR